MDNSLELNENIPRAQKKVLLSIRNLKQYFPVKKNKNIFVKANDGITIDIYEGETLGVVGESGCGKSTLGRVLLQLYHQTDGETLYFGRTRDSIAPKYVLKVYENLEQKCKEAKELVRQLEKLEKENEELEKKTHDSTNKNDLTHLFKKKEEIVKAKRIAENSFLNIVNLVGGFYIATDYKAVSGAYVKLHEATIEARETTRAIAKLELEKNSLQAVLKQKNISEKSNGKFNSLEQKINTLKTKLEAQNSVISARYEEIGKLREKYAKDPEFAKYEAYRNDGIDLARLSYNEMRGLRKDMQVIFQDPYSSLNPRMTVGQIVSEGVTEHKYYKKGDSRLQEYTMQVMENCGLAPYMIHRYPHQFSGGQRQRIGIARALSVKPRFIVCDEAVSALDVSIQSQIINLLQELKEQENLTYMFISHDLSVVKYISDRIAVMYLGNIVELAYSADIFRNPLHPYTEALLTAIPTVDSEGKKEMALLEGDIPSPINPPKGCKFHTRCRYCMDICKEVTPEFVELEKDHFAACHYRHKQ